MLRATLIAAFTIGLLALTPETYAFGPKHHRHGVVIKSLPKHHTVVRVSGKRYFVHSGVYYRAYGKSFRVVAAPVGYRIKALPRTHISFRIGPISYYYAAGNYYRRQDHQYVVVAKPVGAPANLDNDTLTASISANLFVYPANGQSKKKTARDKKACRSWANNQPETHEESDFLRAYSTCLEGRGYSVG